MLYALGTIGGTELIIVLVVVLVLFGGSQLPKLARSIGEAQKEFKSGLNEDEQRKDERKPSA
jgi:sec-independent protein translocase protein TatA